MSFVGDPQRAHQVPSRICGDSGYLLGRNAVYPNVRLPELTGETDLVSIDSRDIDAEIGAFKMPT